MFSSPRSVGVMHAAFLTEAGVYTKPHSTGELSQATRSLQDGQVYCLGRNSYGECDDPDLLFISLPFALLVLCCIVRLCPTCGKLLIMMMVFIDLSIRSKQKIGHPGLQYSP